MKLPKTGVKWADLDVQLDEARAGDVDWRGGRIGVYIHYGGEDVLEVAKKAYLKFFSENGLGPKAFPSLERFERDVIAMTVGLFNGGPGACGAMTTGGTESIFLAVKAARDWSRAHRPVKGVAEIVVPETAHPAFNKAAYFYDMQVRRVPVGADYRANAEATAAAIGANTIMLVGSAPAYPHGVMDPIADLAELAGRHDLWMHVDACVGGFIAPFARMLGEPIEAFDFSLPAVRSISADLHKYGYAAKGASTITYRDAESFAFQAYEFDEWPRGKYSTNTLVGTRAGGAIAAAWAVMNYLGESGYMDVTRRILAIRKALEAGVGELGLSVWGQPQLGILTYGTRELDMGVISDRIAERNWFVGRLVEPPGIHLMLNLTHEPVTAEYLADLKWAVQGAPAAAPGSGVGKATY